jgi:hypothetical protein
MAATVLDERPKLETNKVRVLDKLSAGDSNEPSTGVSDEMSLYFKQTAAWVSDKWQSDVLMNYRSSFLNAGWSFGRMAVGVLDEPQLEFLEEQGRSFRWTAAGFLDEMWSEFRTMLRQDRLFNVLLQIFMSTVGGWSHLLE